MLTLSRGLKQKMNRFQELGAMVSPVLYTGHMSEVTRILKLPNQGWLSADTSGEMVLWTQDGNMIARLQGTSLLLPLLMFKTPSSFQVPEWTNRSLGFVYRKVIVHVSTQQRPILWAAIDSTNTVLTFSAENGIGQQWDIAQRRLIGPEGALYDLEGSLAKQSLLFKQSSLLPFAVKSFGDQFLVLDQSQNPKVWRENSPRQILYGHRYPIVDAAVSEERILTLDSRGEVRLWDSDTLTLQHIVRSKRRRAYQDDAGQKLAWSPVANKAVVLGVDGALRLINTENGRPTGHLKAGFNPLTMSFSPDGTRFFAASSSKALIWDVSSQRLLVEINLQDLARHTFSTLTADWRADGEQLALTHSQGIVLVSSETGEYMGQLGQVFKGDVQPKLSQAKDKAVISTKDNRVQVWNLLDQTLEWSAETKQTALSHVDFSAESNRVLSVNMDGDVMVSKLTPDSRPLIIEGIAASTKRPQAQFSLTGDLILAAHSDVQSDTFGDHIPLMSDGSPIIDMVPPDVSPTVSIGTDPILYKFKHWKA